MQPLPELAGQSPEVWWIAFSDKCQHGPILRILTRRRRRHCLMFTALADDVVLVLDPLQGRLLIFHVHEPVAETIKRCREKDFDLLIIERTVPIGSLLRFPVFARSPVLTCASQIAYVLSLKGWIYTPQRLWRAILENGGEVVFENGSSSTVHSPNSVVDRRLTGWRARSKRIWAKRTRFLVARHSERRRRTTGA